MTSGPVLPYHDSGDPRYSLRYLTDDPEEWKRERIERTLEDGVETMSKKSDVAGQTVYHIYTKTVFEAAYPDFDTDDDAIRWLEEHFSDGDMMVVLSVLEIFDGIRSELEEQGASFTTYKEFDLERIPRVLNRVEWQQSVPEVGAELLSNFILIHPMPNTNHRTAIGLLDRYLTSIDDSFVMPDTGVEGEWFKWAREYILDSKRLLTLRRNVPLFRVAHELGYVAVERTEGITISFDDIDFGMADPYQYYTIRHIERSQAFVETLLEQANAQHLSNEVDQGKRTFTDRLRGEQ